jgi:hypothetical protein
MPYYRYEWNVQLSPEEVAARIAGITDKPRSFWESFRGWSPGKGSKQHFRGTVSHLSFRLQRDIGYRNSFLPIIRGQISSEGRGSRIQMTMYLHPFTAVFMAAWLSIALGATLAAAGHYATLYTYDVLGPAAMFTFGAGIVSLGFFPEALLAKRLVKRLSSGEVRVKCG